MKILLAPMEGVVDQYMRQTLTAVGGYDHCVTEFVRVVDQLLPQKTFKRLCPELNNSGKTASGTPVVVQLLGADPSAMALNAERAVAMGAPGIDLNFGCPAKCSSKKSGGSFLLTEPHRLFDIISAVRTAVPSSIPVSAKIRLGFENTDLALDNAKAVEEAGASYITVHARTKVDGYKAPARWEWLTTIKDALNIPVVANGDINTVKDFEECIALCGCDAIMIGRGAVSRPDLAKQIMMFQQGKTLTPFTWPDILLLLLKMAESMEGETKKQKIVARIKQWLVMLKKQYPEAQLCFDKIRKIIDYAELKLLLTNK